MENDEVVTDLRRPDPEVQAGRALRRLRGARGWSQEEVAARMRAYGYDFHQTMIAKIEAAQRPLRVRELADFAALYGVGVQDLVYPPTASLSETDQDIAAIEKKLEEMQREVTAAQQQLSYAETMRESAEEAMRSAQGVYQRYATEVAVLTQRLTSLQAEREKLASWESGRDTSLGQDSDKTQQNVFEPTVTSTTSKAGAPTALRILLGAQLRRLRERAKIGPEQAAFEIRASPSKINRLEAGRLGFKEPDLTHLLTLYHVSDNEIQLLLDLNRRANAPAWWHDYADILPDWFETYLSIERAAGAQILAYEAQFVPDLLQTEDYARTVMLLSPDARSTREIERKVQLRMARQAVLERSDPPSLRVVVNDAALRRQVGGPAVMRNQLMHLAEMAKRPNITVQVLPSQASDRLAVGSFGILRLSDPDLPDVVYLEQFTSALYLDKPEVVSSYLSDIERLSDQTLTPRETIQFLEQLLETPSPRAVSNSS